MKLMSDEIPDATYIELVRSVFETLLPTAIIAGILQIIRPPSHNSDG